MYPRCYIIEITLFIIYPSPAVIIDIKTEEVLTMKTVSEVSEIIGNRLLIGDNYRARESRPHDSIQSSANLFKHMTQDDSAAYTKDMLRHCSQSSARGSSRWTGSFTRTRV